MSSGHYLLCDACFALAGVRKEKTCGTIVSHEWIEERVDAVVEIDRVAVCFDQQEGYLSRALSPKGARELARRLLEAADYAEQSK